MSDSMSKESPGSVSDQPNVLVIVVDDLAYGDLSCLGNPYTETTELDALHEKSVRLNRYCSGPLCTPARAALMTGRHPFRTRAIDTYLGRSNLDPSEVTLAHRFRESGYRTGLFGKWHLGDTAPSDPNSMGFDEALYHTGGGLRQPGNFGYNSYFDPDLIHNREMVSSRGYCTDIFSEAACEFMSTSEEPFFAYLAFNAIHTPLEIVEEWADPFREKGLPEVWCRLYGMLQNLDENVGKVIAGLDRRGQRDNTIILFTADHGPCGSARHEGEIRFNAGLRGGKGEFYEGGIRVPCFWSWPQRWSPREVEVLANPIDVLPTLESVCRLSKGKQVHLDGADLSCVLEKGAVSESLEARGICMQWHRGPRPNRGKNAVCLGPRHKWYSKDSGAVELYDLIVDPKEQRDIAGENPKVCAEMQAMYDEWFDDVCRDRELLDLKKDPGVPVRIDGESDDLTVLTWQDWVPYDAKEGWSEENPGYWLVSINRPQLSRIVVDRVNETGPGQLVFRWGSEEKVLPAYDKVQTFCFEANLSAGTGRLECFFQVGAQKIGVDTIRIRRMGD